MKMKKWAALAALLLAVGAATGATAEVAVNDHVFFGHYEQDNDLTLSLIHISEPTRP